MKRPNRLFLMALPLLLTGIAASHQTASAAEVTFTMGVDVPSTATIKQAFAQIGNPDANTSYTLLLEGKTYAGAAEIGNDALGSMVALYVPEGWNLRGASMPAQTTIIDTTIVPVGRNDLSGLVNEWTGSGFSGYQAHYYFNPGITGLPSGAGSYVTIHDNVIKGKFTGSTVVGAAAEDFSGRGVYSLDPNTTATLVIDNEFINMLVPLSIAGEGVLVRENLIHQNYTGFHMPYGDFSDWGTEDYHGDNIVRENTVIGQVSNAPPTKTAVAIESHLVSTFAQFNYWYDATGTFIDDPDAIVASIVFVGSRKDAAKQAGEQFVVEPLYTSPHPDFPDPNWTSVVEWRIIGQ